MKSLVALLMLLLLGATRPANQPSFSCTAALALAESAICSDPELAAWDRAVAKVYRVLSRDGGVSFVDQRRWLDERNRCAADRTCLLKAYREWDGWQSQAVGFGNVYTRSGSTYADSAVIEILPIFDGWMYFSINAIHVQDARIGAVNDGGAWGLLELRNGRATYDQEPGAPYGCRFHIEKAKQGRWLIKEFDFANSCGGLNVTLSGEYRPDSGHKR